jgi:RNA recognition motif-containing protein
MNIYIGNLSYDTTEDELREAFESFGEVANVNILSDKYSGKPRGFAFVEMSDKSQAEAAINGLNGKELKGRALNVSEARPRTEDGGGGGGRGGRGGGGGGRGGDRGNRGGGGGRGRNW